MKIKLFYTNIRDNHKSIIIELENIKAINENGYQAISNDDYIKAVAVAKNTLKDKKMSYSAFYSYEVIGGINKWQNTI